MPENHNPIAVPGTIDDVLEALDQIVEISIRENSAAGIFAYVYRRTTAKVKESIRDGRFEDNPRMERFDVVFARKYITAYWNHREGKPVAEVWKKAFKTEGRDAIILQHVLLGMNAHINYDLAVAAAEFAPGNEIHMLKSDFMLINRLLAELVDELQDRIARVSPLLFLLDWVAKDEDEAIVNFSMEKAREQAWRFAVLLAGADESEQKLIKDKTDMAMTKLAGIVADPPGFLLPKVLGLIRLFEEKEIQQVIQKIQL